MYSLGKGNKNKRFLVCHKIMNAGILFIGTLNYTTVFVMSFNQYKESYVLPHSLFYFFEWNNSHYGDGHGQSIFKKCYE